jgi:colanic acid biosynthesis protein WcaH
MIDDKQFLEIIDATPLVSIDLILEDNEGRVLLGKRVNRPAQGDWFVPGGRIRKNETLADAMARISLVELGKAISITDAKLLGTYDHIYTDNCFGKDGVNTHYVVLGYQVNAQAGLKVVTDDQHSEVRWWSISELLNSDEVHQNTKNYFL